ncbi:carboxypeptidase regulatory-like domain-containing protein [Pontibacter harenae]|uniref:carboxypeptidase regulatory-like domain-containing protein n=1 Tax=Pontibacter harenae TaxID=2894083 RepID=UPI001E2EAB08|nr:carboxypeptidase regulatory-like domain-containing protein [Pontibacter harenae]MCC9166408.1 carboxypeptidase regulatory-like domain-containing protein [Pontibacter harenae]
MAKLLLLPLALLLSGCNGSKAVQEETHYEMEQTNAAAGVEKQEQQMAVKEGITGKVLWQSGNQMPSPDAPQSRSKRGVQRTLYIYELTNSSQTTTTDGVFHTNIQTDLVTQVATAADGSFTVSLKPGRYSLFTKEENGLYANLFDGENNIFPVEVKKGELTNVEFLINYNAHY